MSSIEDEEELTEEQRISLLEKSVSSSKISLLIVALVLIITISVAITAGVITALSGNNKNTVSIKEFLQTQAEITHLKKTLAVQNTKINQLAQKYPQLKALFNNSSAPAFQKLFLEQEKSFQAFLGGMKSGMYDLAHMVPGSRTWLDMYNAQMNKALQASQQRTRELQKLNTGQVLIEP